MLERTLVTPPKMAMYIHWPFCVSKCPYCDFNSHVASQINYDDWKNAYIAELSYFAEKCVGYEIDTIFFGGGTPSLMPPDLTHSILSAVARLYKLSSDAEITLEANPNSVEAKNFKSLSEAGINRVSLGIQSLDDERLKFLGRAHNSSEAIEAISKARDCFPKYNLDAIYALPDETWESWEKELSKFIDLSGGHLSLYQLTIEKGTPFYSAHKRKEFILPDEDIATNLYVNTEEYLAKYSYDCYEVSNYAKPGFECAHNLHYWNYDQYVGIGPGAHGRLFAIDEKNNPTRQATMMIHNPSGWLESCAKNGHGLQSDTVLSFEDAISERLLMGLRLKNGIDFSVLAKSEKSALEVNLDYNRIKHFIKTGLMVDIKDGLCLTKSGKLLLNYVLKEIWN